MAKQHSPTGAVLVYSGDGTHQPRMHEIATRTAMAKKLAALKSYTYAGEYDRSSRYDGPLYYVPAHTLVDQEARELGISSDDDFFGGVVPHAFAATKTITHPLVSADAFAPKGWSTQFSGLLGDAVLAGFSAFTASDVRLATKRLLERGQPRIKEACGIGGSGQHVISNMNEVDAVLDAIDPAELSNFGVVIEQNLEKVTTYSVGQLHVADLWIAYYGTQRLTTNHHGVEVYGGSDLVVMRGRYDALLARDVPAEARRAIAHARQYDAAVASAYPGFLASRRNYDVAVGVDGDGTALCGVLEQSWRIGGASPAEIAALEAFTADATLQMVRASSHEVFSASAAVPPHANVYFQGVDDHVGAMTKYSVSEAVRESYGNAT